MYHTKLDGSYRQMGHQQGRPLKRIGFTPPPPEEKMLRFARQCSEAIDVEAAKRALSDHQGGVCSHGVEDGRKYGTIWSIVGHPGKRQLEVAEGHPRRAKYRLTSF